jgi:hypothetical protein
MILIEYLRENEIQLSSKGSSAMAKAIRDVFEIVDDGIDDDKLVGRVLTYDLTQEECLRIMELTAKYAKLWLFS